MVGHACHTRDVTLCKDSVPLSLRKGASKQGFKLPPTAKLSRFSDRLKSNLSPVIHFFLFSHHNTPLLLYLLWEIRGALPDPASEVAADLIFLLLVPTWWLCAWLLLCREVWWSRFLEEYESLEWHRAHHPAEHSSVERCPAGLKEAVSATALGSAWGTAKPPLSCVQAQQEETAPSPNALWPPADLNLCAPFPEASQSLHWCVQVHLDPAAGKAQISCTSLSLRDAVLSICLGLARICLLPELRFISTICLPSTSFCVPPVFNRELSRTWFSSPILDVWGLCD